MSLLSLPLDNLVQGISQQPYLQRLGSQAEVQVNGLSSVVDGLSKRPPTRHILRIHPYPDTSVFVHAINRDLNEKYLMLIRNGSLVVHTLDGEQVPVAAPDGGQYLAENVGNPEEDFAAVTVADYTFILNKRVQVRKDLIDKTDQRPAEALVWIRQSNYSMKYSVHVDGASATYTTPNAEGPWSAAYITSDYIAGSLATQLQANLGGPSGPYYVEMVGGAAFYVKRDDNAEFAISIADGMGDMAMKLAKGSVARMSDVPAKCKPGFVIRVRGSSDTVRDDYYMTYEAQPGNQYAGVWVECAKPNEIRSFDKATMPHVLVRESSGTFTFRQFDWQPRMVGDVEKTCPFPTFAEKTINDIFFHRNRLGFLSDENIIFSRAGGSAGSIGYDNWFRGTALQTLDDDPIDIGTTNTKVSILNFAVPFNEKLLLFSDQTQFQIAVSQGMLTPKTISVNPTTQFEAARGCRPVGAGTSVYFATERGLYSNVREYYLDGDKQANDAADITAHCPAYLPEGMFKIAASTAENMLVALCRGSQNNFQEVPDPATNVRNRLYVYRWFSQNGNKMQSSWSYWELEPEVTILAAEFFGSNLYLVVTRPEGTYLEVIATDPGRHDEVALNGGVAAVDVAPMTVNLDRRFSEQGTFLPPEYDPVSNTTTFIAPYHINPYDSRFKLVAWYNNIDFRPGQVVEHTREPIDGSRTIITVQGRLDYFFAGIEYLFRYQFSTQVLRDKEGQKMSGNARVQLKRGFLNYTDSGYFIVQVRMTGRDPFHYIFSGRKLGSLKNLIGEMAIETGTFSFPILSQNTECEIEIFNPSYLPSNFLAANIELYNKQRGRRL